MIQAYKKVRYVDEDHHKTDLAIEKSYASTYSIINEEGEALVIGERTDLLKLRDFIVEVCSSFNLALNADSDSNEGG